MQRDETIPFHNESCSDEERALLQAKFWKLLARQTALFTMGESRSVPHETARELLRSLCYTLKIDGIHDVERIKKLLSVDLQEEYSRCVRILEIKKKTGHRLWQTVCLRAPTLRNQAMEDTLYSIGGFWKRYDIHYFAHRIPCDIDYPLCHPVPDSLQGVDYVTEYLRRLMMENNLLCRLDTSCCERLLESLHPHYRWLVLNLYEPIAANALGLTLVNGDIRSLKITPSIREKILSLLSTLPEADALQRLRRAAQSLCWELNIHSSFSQMYLEDWAVSLLPRIRSCASCGIFLSF